MTMAAEAGPRAPAHVRADLVWDHDFNAFLAEGRDPFRSASRLHDGPPMVWASRIDPRRGGWVPTRHALIREVLIDSDRFSSQSGEFMSLVGEDWGLIPLELDPPEHHLYRKALEPFFSPSAVNALDGRVRAICDQLIAGFADREACEFISEFASLFPHYVFLDMMGMPRARLPQFLAWERGMLHPKSLDEQAASMRSILDYLTAFIAEQRPDPQTPLMKSILGARYEDRPLTEDELLSICFVMYIGGLDTVYSTLGWILWHLAQDRPLQERLRANPQDLTNAVEELLRAYSITGSQRRVTRDLEFHGVPMKQGDRVLISLTLAGRDPEVYADPHTVDIDRPVRHIAFGTGPHTCLGLRLAKREIRIVLETFLARFRDIRLGEGADYAFHTGVVIGLDRLPLAWDLAGG
jgi:cytochrome P450